MSIDQLEAEIDRRRRQVPELRRQREELAMRLESIDRELAVLGGGSSGGAQPARRGPGRPPGPAGRRRRRGRPKGAVSGARRGPGRPRNEGSLVQTLGRALKGHTMSVSEAADAAQKQGYKTTSPNFRTIVNQALLSNPDRFKKVARGQYTSKD